MSNDTLSDLTEAARLHYAYLNQGDIWVPKDKPPIRITDMDAAWRHNAARFLTRRAAYLLMQYEMGEFLRIFHPAPVREVIGEEDGQPVYGREVSLGPTPGGMAEASLERGLHEEHEQRSADLEAWITSTDLYKALTEGLPDDAADLAKHWSDCAVRNEGGECNCRERHVTECPKCEDIDATCQCSDYSPEWTR